MNDQPNVDRPVFRGLNGDYYQRIESKPGQPYFAGYVNWRKAHLVNEGRPIYMEEPWFSPRCDEEEDPWFKPRLKDVEHWYNPKRRHKRRKAKKSRRRSKRFITKN